MAGDQGYQGGNDTILGGYFSGLQGAFNRNQARLAKEAQTQAKAMADDQKELSAIVRKVNTAGVQTIDVPDVTKKLDDVYNTYYLANKAQDQSKRIELRMDLERKITDLGNFVSLSKQRGVDEVKLADNIAKSPGLYSQDSIKKFRESSGMPTSKLGERAFSIDRYISPDTSYIDKTFDASAKTLLSTADKDLVEGRLKQYGNRMGTPITQVQQVLKDAFGTEMMRAYNADTKFKNTVDYTANNMGVTPEQYISTVVEEYDRSGRLGQKIEQRPIMNAIPRAAKGGDDGGVGTGVINDYAVTYGTTNVEGSQSPNSAIVASSFGHLPAAKVTLAGKYDVIDSSTGEFVKIPETSTEFKRVGYGYFPVASKTFKTKSGKTIKAGAPLTKAFADKNPNYAKTEPKVIVQVEGEGFGKFKDKVNYLVEPEKAIAVSKMTKGEKAVKSAVDQDFNSRRQVAPAAKQPTSKPATKAAPTKLKKGGLDGI